MTGVSLSLPASFSLPVCPYLPLSVTPSPCPSLCPCPYPFLVGPASPSYLPASVSPLYTGLCPCRCRFLCFSVMLTRSDTYRHLVGLHTLTLTHPHPHKHTHTPTHTHPHSLFGAFSIHYYKMEHSPSVLERCNTGIKTVRRRALSLMSTPFIIDVTLNKNNPYSCAPRVPVRHQHNRHSSRQQSKTCCSDGLMTHVGSNDAPPRLSHPGSPGRSQKS